MSTKLKQQETLTNREYKQWKHNWKDWYWDEGVWFYNRKRSTFNIPRREIYYYQYRMYRTWKHNRRTQYRE